MAVHEHSVGPLYFARVKTVEDAFPVHKVGIVEMCPPWRRGSALVFPGWSYHGWVIGLWWRSMEQDIAEDFEGAQWFEPKWLDTAVDDIAQWRTDAEAANESTEP